MCDEGDLKFDNDPVLQTTVDNCLKRIDSKNITKNNAFPLIYWALLSEMQVKDIENIVVIRDRVNLVCQGRR